MWITHHRLSEDTVFRQWRSIASFGHTPQCGRSVPKPTRRRFWVSFLESTPHSPSGGRPLKLRDAQTDGLVTSEILRFQIGARWPATSGRQMRRKPAWQATLARPLGGCFRYGGAGRMRCCAGQARRSPGAGHGTVRSEQVLIARTLPSAPASGRTMRQQRRPR